MDYGKQASDASGVIAVNGAHLHYRIEGSGPPCLVVASVVYHPRTFSPQLREQFELIFVDIRPFVPSDPAFDVNQITLDTYANDIEQVCQVLGLDKVVVIGHSICGPLVLEYARRFPQRVQGVVMIAAPPCGVVEMDRASEQFWQADANMERKAVLQANAPKLTPEVLNSLDPGEVVAHTYVANGPMYWYDPHYDASWLWAGVYVNAPLFDHLFGRLFATYDLAQGPGQITVPVLLILGRYDYVVPYTLWEGQQATLPQLTYHLFDKSGHTPQLEEPDHFDQVLIEWVRRHIEPSA
jgi:proline iminopeptidase